MARYADDSGFRTHEVENQPPPLAPYNLYTSDAALREAVGRNGGGWADERLAAYGAKLGQAETFDLGFQANEHPPRLVTHDRYGRRRDEVEFHPAWHRLMALAIGAGTHTGPWADPRPGAHVARAAQVIMTTEVEAGIQCPITMTYGVVPALRREPALAAEWLPRLYRQAYDSRFIPAPDKTGMLMGMGMTEKQGGTDLRTNSTRAEPAGTVGEYRLTGHKWFFSAPMCDAFLVLAQAPAGPTCLFLPRFTPDGALNAIRVQRLKSKLGNHANASSEVEFHGAWARRVGDEGRGIPTIIEMATYTRLDCALGTSGLMRQAVSQASHHAAHRTVFQRRLNDQPLMQNVLADLALEAEAAIALSMRLARAVDRHDDPAERAFHRLMTPAIKYWVCKRGVALAGEAMEVLGGVGYTEETIMPRLYREMPVNSIWEGSGNVMCLDVLRALQRHPDALGLVLDELRPARSERRLDRHLAALESSLRDPAGLEGRARRITEGLALAVQAALLIEHAPGAVADAFVSSRLEGGWSGTFGTLPAGLDLRTIVTRATPEAVAG
jgi:putative acyl-CoA dehydrogenase